MKKTTWLLIVWLLQGAELSLFGARAKGLGVFLLFALIAMAMRSAPEIVPELIVIAIGNL